MKVMTTLILVLFVLVLMELTQQLLSKCCCCGVFIATLLLSDKMSVGNGYQLNHILKTRDLVSRNNEKLQHQHANELGGKSRDVIDPPRDQGFTRPKVNYLEPLDYYQYPEY